MILILILFFNNLHEAFTFPREKKIERYNLVIIYNFSNDQETMNEIIFCISD